MNEYFEAKDDLDQHEHFCMCVCNALHTVGSQEMFAEMKEQNRYQHYRSAEFSCNTYVQIYTNTWHSEKQRKNIYLK